VTQTTVERNGSPPDRYDVGRELVTSGRTITETDLVSFAALTGDWHPQHSDAAWASGSRFGGRVAHGMLLLSYAVGLFPFDPERVVALRGIDSVSFKRPVRIGDTVRVASRVERADEIEPGLALVVLSWRLLNQNDEVVVRAKVTALWSDGEAAEAAPAQAAPEIDIYEDLGPIYGQRLAL
jgi:3-hydroxybutyryl-CoA dehydratase